MASQEIQSYIERGGEGQLKRAQREIEALKTEVERLEKDQQAIVREVKRHEDALRNVDDTKRQISDNQRYRRDLRALKSVRADIERLVQTNAEADKVRNEREGARYQLERQELASEQATIVGQMKTKDNNLKQLLADYEIEYKDAAKQYKLAHIQVETTKACIEDLGRYIGALDKAIMKYHTLKMDEINRIIDELWRKTYQGTDIDTIRIKSESEDAKANKSYNYRVVMYKSDAEMDMRGRCSAGQRVLASIIIRLSLAECFGVNCGLIALDEPTTNLDQENIRALAMSLSEIIRVRRQQKNFQLIVITHDEDFLRAMQCGDFADNYWRVSRNDKQKSIIERQSIAEVM
jgi:DNA repair protein RAD50